MQILKAEQLPRPGDAAEGGQMEFKEVCTGDGFELAKDVSAFANGLGGVILVGAVGDGERLGRYKPLSDTEASTAHRSYDQAIRDRCRPLPTYSIEHLRHDGGTVVAVNVEPYLGALVGVEVKNGEAKCGAKGKQPEGLFFFPRRIGAHTK
jgi:predicted HTH transcriptional regulator